MPATSRSNSVSLSRPPARTVDGAPGGRASGEPDGQPSRKRSAPARSPGARAPRSHVPYPVAARDLLRNTLLDAARDQLWSRPWHEVTMADVARAAGVSRQTLYNELGSREGLAQALVLREADHLLARVEHAVRSHLDDPATALAEAFDVFLRAAAENPLVQNLFSGEADELLALVTTRGKPLVSYAVERLSAVMTAGWPLAPPEDCELLSECLVRLAISHAALPMRPSGITAASVERLFGPYIERVLVSAAA
jgi:AcrR family transcriptional regulator